MGGDLNQDVAFASQVRFVRTRSEERICCEFNGLRQDALQQSCSNKVVMKCQSPVTPTCWPCKRMTEWQSHSLKMSSKRTKSRMTLFPSYYLGRFLNLIQRSSHSRNDSLFLFRMRSGTLVSKQCNRQRLIPSIPISDEEGVGIASSQIAGKNVSTADQGINDEFIKFVRERQGPLGSAVLKSKLEGDEVKGLVGNVELGGPTSYRIKQIVIAVKQLAQEFFA